VLMQEPTPRVEGPQLTGGGGVSRNGSVDADAHSHPTMSPLQPSILLQPDHQTEKKHRQPDLQVPVRIFAWRPFGGRPALDRVAVSPVAPKRRDLLVERVASGSHSTLLLATGTRPGGASVPHGTCAACQRAEGDTTLLLSFSL
jgi:hypothetical protein